MSMQTFVIVKPLHVSMFGSLNAAYLLGQLIYWDKINKGEEFYNTDQEFADQLRIGLKALRGAKNILKSIGLVSVVLRGMPAKTYYKINSEKLDNLEWSFIQQGSLSLPKKDKQDCLQKANCDASNRQTSLPKRDKLVCLQKASKIALNDHQDCLQKANTDAYKRQTTHYMANNITKNKNTNITDSGNFDDPEGQGVSVSKNDSEKTLENISQGDLEAGIQNTPPGGVDPVIEKKPSKVFLKEGFNSDHSDNSDSDPFHDPSGGSSKSDHVPEDLLDEDPGYEESGYDYSLEERDLEEGDRNELSNGLEADRIKASRGDFMHAQAPLKQPSETNTPKTCHFSASDGLPLQDIKSDQKTSVVCLKTPAIDMSDGGGEGESKKGVSRKQQKKENRGTRIDETMVLDKNKLDIALNQGFHGSWVVSEFEEFVRYYANPNLASSKALHVNWEATWRNWCKNAIVYDRYGKKSKPHPTNTTPSFESSAASLPSPAVDSRLQDFVKKHPTIDSLFAFSFCKAIDQGDTILITAPTAFYKDKVDCHAGKLEAYFGKRVDFDLDTPPRSQSPQNNESHYIAVDYVVQENHPKETSPNSLLQDIEVPSRVDNFPYKSIGVVLQEAMQGGMR